MNPPGPLCVYGSLSAGCGRLPSALPHGGFRLLLLGNHPRVRRWGPLLGRAVDQLQVLESYAVTLAVDFNRCRR